MKITSCNLVLISITVVSRKYTHGIPQKGVWAYFNSCDISLKNTPTSHTVSLALIAYVCSDSAILFAMHFLMQ